ncbi:hypothetical protein Peur_038609 [Populus x canadensis]
MHQVLHLLVLYSLQKLYAFASKTMRYRPLPHCSSNNRTAETNRNQRIVSISNFTTMNQTILSSSVINLCTK